ncbi:MAG TPA: hypothetical protein VI750_06110 [Pyrinomonadaceae bacterium]|nr:hypothetical protein [Pyrinomonadaceae bacterium]
MRKRLTIASSDSSTVDQAREILHGHNRDSTGYIEIKESPFRYIGSAEV